MRAQLRLRVHHEHLHAIALEEEVTYARLQEEGVPDAPRKAVCSVRVLYELDLRTRDPVSAGDLVGAMLLDETAHCAPGLTDQTVALAQPRRMPRHCDETRVVGGIEHRAVPLGRKTHESADERFLMLAWVGTVAALTHES